MNKPVLIVGFNRPDLTRQVMEKVREYQPPTVYLACDGPRPNHRTDHNLVQEVRSELLRVDWRCSVHTKFESSNLGLRDSMVAAIDWFFSHENEGIILEDDCLPASDFFPFMEFILDTYRDEKKVWGGSGSNPLSLVGGSDASFSFVGTALIWGWGTWADRWQLYDRNLKNYASSGFKGNASKWQDRHTFYALDWHLTRLLKMVTPDSWAYQWAWTISYYSGLWIVPHQNLIRNTGFRADATHTKSHPGYPQVLGNFDSFEPPPTLQNNLTLQRQIHNRQHRVLSPLFLNRIRDLVRWLRNLLTEWKRGSH